MPELEGGPNLIEQYPLCPSAPLHVWQEALRGAYGGGGPNVPNMKDSQQSRYMLRCVASIMGEVGPVNGKK